MPENNSAMDDAASAGKGAPKERKINPLLKKARGKYVRKLKATGASEDEISAGVKSYMKDKARPAFEEARKAANAKSLKGDERQQFLERILAEKLNWGG